MLGVRIALLRWERGMSQAELAGRLHISASAVGMYEQGRRMPSLDIVVQLSREFGVTTDYLLTGETSLTEPAMAHSGTDAELKTEALLRILTQVAGR